MRDNSDVAMTPCVTNTFCDTHTGGQGVANRPTLHGVVRPRRETPSGSDRSSAGVVRGCAPNRLDHPLAMCLFFADMGLRM